MFAAIPLVFAMQQFSEGFVWLSLTNPTDQLSPRISGSFFLSFALIIWPLWVPLAMFFMEKNIKRRKILGLLSGMGILFSIASIYYLCAYNSSAEIAHYHIHYNLKISDKILLVAGTFYLIPTVISHFISSVKSVSFMGLLVVLSHIIAKTLF